MGGREWPQRPLLGIIVTQAISCLEVWEKEKKKNPRWGQGELGGGEPESGVLEGSGRAQLLSPASSRPRGCQMRQPGQGDAAYC